VGSRFEKRVSCRRCLVEGEIWPSLQLNKMGFGADNFPGPTEGGRKMRVTGDSKGTTTSERADDSGVRS